MKRLFTTYSNTSLFLLALLFLNNLSVHAQTTIGGVKLGKLTDYLFVFTDASSDANWQGATKGFVGNVAIKGTLADERTSGTVPYAGTIYTDDNSLSAWQNIIEDNSSQANGQLNKTSSVDSLVNDLEYCFAQINALTATSGYSNFKSTDLNNLNTQNNVAQMLVINITSGFSVSSTINITGDADDVFILRWDTDADFANGYDGQVKFQSGGGIVPLGGLKACNFIHVAGEINSSGGGSTPTANDFPQGPRLNNGTGNLITGASDFNGGGFFTGYWLTTGKPTIFPTGKQPYGNNPSLSNAIFVGGWYSKTDKFSMTSGTSGVYVGVQVALPVTWLNVKATKNGDLNNIEWSTASEENNDFFTIEKSLDNIDFEVIGTVKGAGNKNSISQYAFNDNNASDNSVYYRIKQTDYNGAYSYSATVVVSNYKVLETVAVYPNPAIDKVQINLNTPVKTSGTIQLLNIQGQIVLEQLLQNGQIEIELAIPTLTNGIYYAQIKADNSEATQTKFIVYK